MPVEMKIHDNTHEASMIINTSNVRTNKYKGGLKIEEMIWNSAIRPDTDMLGSKQVDIIKGICIYKFEDWSEDIIEYISCNWYQYLIFLLNNFT